MQQRRSRYASMQMPRADDDLHLFEALLRNFSRSRDVDLDAQAVIFNLYRASTDVIAAMEAAALQPSGLTHAGFVLLMALWIAGSREVRELAQLQRVSRPAIVSAVRTLERANLARRVRSETDRRLVRVELTPRGRELIGRVQEVQHRFERAVTRALTAAEKQTLADLLRRIAQAARVRDEK